MRKNHHQFLVIHFWMTDAILELLKIRDGSGRSTTRRTQREVRDEKKKCLLLVRSANAGGATSVWRRHGNCELSPLYGRQKKISKESIAGTRDRSKLRLREIVERFSKQAPKEEKLMGYNLWEPKLQEEE